MADINHTLLVIILNVNGLRTNQKSGSCRMDLENKSIQLYAISKRYTFKTRQIHWKLWMEEIYHANSNQKRAKSLYWKVYK